MRRSAAVLTLLLLIATSSFAQVRRRAMLPPTDDGLTFPQWVALRAIPFDTVEPGSDDRDLAPLSDLVGNHKYVGVGEATHGSHEFFAMKARMFRYLVEHKGFTVFSIEGNLPEADAINDYVQTGNGDPVALVHGMHFWTWSVEELEDLVVWMHEYNVAHPDRPQLSFRGFDMQYSQAAIAGAEAYVQRVDPQRANAFAANLSCANVDFSVYQSLSTSAKNDCRTKVAAAYQTIESSRDAYVAASSAAEYERMLRYTKVAIQFEDLAGHTPTSRDLWMAENAEWIVEVEHPGEKMMMWAHNYHIGRASGVQMGTYFNAHFPNDHMSFGFVFDYGNFNARDFTTHALQEKHVDEAHDNGYDAVFRSANRPYFFLDMRKAPRSVLNDLYGSTHARYDIGAVYPVPRVRAPIGPEWDVVIWVAVSTASHLK
ncbi:MAG TPA: erythromycin esterase family protein [Thermoanaerobaculia bacterium]|nr:erythromycin esterase family protein [Thermoanaerobaculia bacterium]